MAKNKIKTSVMETKCEEIKAGVWQWTVGQFVWQFQPGWAGVNLKFRQTGSEDWHNMIYAKTLDLAVMFSQGVDGGLQVCRNLRLYEA